MQLSPQDVTALLQREGSGLSPEAYDEVTEPEEAQPRRTKLLADVLETCQQALQQKSSSLEVIAKTLGDGSRDVAWRLPYGDSGILDFFLEILAADEAQSHGIKVHALRIVGNSCADTNENRERVVVGKHIATIIRHLQDDGLVPFLIPVLYNTLVDYDPAQLLGSQDGLNTHLVKLLPSLITSDSTHLIDFVCKILSMLITQDGEHAVADPKTAQLLLEIATTTPCKDDVEDFIVLVSTAASYLANESFQQRLLEDQQVQTFLTAFESAHTSFEEDQEKMALLKRLCTSLLTTLADLTGNDAFATYYPLRGSVMQQFMGWFKSRSPNLQSAACLALGNLSRSDEASTALVQEDKIHESLIHILSDPSVTDAQLLHSALSFLKNLAIPETNKAILGELLEPGAVPRVLMIDSLPQVQFSAMSLVRLLLVNSPENVRRICAPRISDLSESSNEHTTVHDVLSVFDRTDTEPTKLEAARSIATICRVLHTSPVSPILPEWRSRNEAVIDSQGTSSTEVDGLLRTSFYKKHDLSKALLFLVTQQKWPILRSEAWFVFALLSRSQDGARLVAGALSTPEAANALSMAVTGKSAPVDEGNVQIEDITSDPAQEVAGSLPGLGLEPQQVDPKQQANIAKVDRENCLVLCTEMVKNEGGLLSTKDVTLVHSLIKQGTELLAPSKPLE